MEMPTLKLQRLLLHLLREAVGPVLVVSDDTDVAVMLLHHYRDGCSVSDIHLLQVTRIQGIGAERSEVTFVVACPIN